MYLSHLFDLDGTLIDSAPDITRAANRGLAALSLAPLPVEVVRRFIGDGFTLLVSRALNFAQQRPLDAIPPEDALRTALAAAWDEYAADPCIDTTLYPHTREVLAQLAQRGPLGIVTNKPYSITELVLHWLDLEEFFAVVIGGDSLPQRKPDPAPVRHALARLGHTTPPLFVGDSANDLHAARKAGLPVALLTHGYTPQAELAALQPEHLLPDLAGLLTL